MSQENVEVVRQGWQAFTERGIEAAAAYYAEDCLLEDFQDLPDAATYEGRMGLSERYRHFVEMWGEFGLKPVEFIDAGDERVVVVASMTGRVKASEFPISGQAFFAYEVGGNKIVRDRAFTSRRAALAAVGLEE